MDNILIEKLEEAAIYTLDVGDAGLFESAAAKIAELEKELKETREICDAVAHVGVDFGYGVYVLEDSVIHRARLILEALKEQGE